MALSFRYYALAGVGAAALAIAAPSTARACTPDGYLGTVCWTAATYCPRQYDNLVGQTYDVNEFPSLFSVVGYWWGGINTTFGMPFMQGREIIGVGQEPGLTLFRIGDYTGVDQRGLWLSQIPVHRHTLDFTAYAATADLMASAEPATGISPTDAIWAASATNMYAATADTTMAAEGATVALTTSSASASTGTTPPAQIYVPTIGPQLGLRACVAIDGQYPPRQ